MDEVGRGAWAGPVSVGVAVVRSGGGDGPLPVWLRDSKMLSERRRESTFDEVARWCARWSVGHASPAECDEWGMVAALRLAAGRALAGLDLVPDALLLDGPYDFLRPPVPPLGPSAAGCPVLPGTVVPVTGGDAGCASIAAASVLAKVVRDRMMRAEAPSFPAYSFEQNKGYPSPVHQIALRGYGLTSIHRRSWGYVDDLPWRPGRRTAPDPRPPANPSARPRGSAGRTRPAA
jgi:ribonuclease HII